MLGAKPLLTRPTAATIEPNTVILQQPNFLTRLAARGPTQSVAPIRTESIDDVILWLALNVSISSFRNIPNVYEVPQTE